MRQNEIAHLDARARVYNAAWHVRNNRRTSPRRQAALRQLAAVVCELLAENDKQETTLYAVAEALHDPRTTTTP